MNAGLIEFTGKALAAGIDRQKIADALQRAGWAEYDIKAAMDAFADDTFPIPVPRPRPYLSAREVFVYLVLFATLYAAAYHMGALLFALTDRFFPDPLRNTSRLALDIEIRWDISVLLVAVPIFVLTFRAVTHALMSDPTKRASRARKWLTYLTLFGASVVLVGDVSTLIYNVLGGELTIRFLLKVVTVALIAGSIFGYFLNDIRKEESE